MRPLVGIPRTDENSRIAHRQLVEKARQGRIDVYFVGDSITRRWGATDPFCREFLQHWQRSFHGWNAANFGWGGDTTANVLWRLENGELDGVHPKVIVLLAGTNDLGNGATADEVVAGIKAILAICRKEAPEATILLHAILPREDVEGLMPAIRAVNQRLAEIPEIVYVDIGPSLTDAQGRLREEMTVDGLHLALPGYEAWAQTLCPLLARLLGPPSNIDLAPPPTGTPL